MDVHKIESSGWGGLSDKGDVSRNKISCANVINKDSVVEVVSFREETIKRVCKLGGKDDCFPLSVVSGGIEMGHGVVESFMKIRVRRGRS